MSNRQVISQNGLTLVNYDKVDHIMTETNINNDIYIYANTAADNKVWLGTYPTIDEAKEVIQCISHWLSNDSEFYANNKNYMHCNYDTFIMPEHYEVEKKG